MARTPSKPTATTKPKPRAPSKPCSSSKPSNSRRVQVRACHKSSKILAENFKNGQKLGKMVKRVWIFRAKSSTYRQKVQTLYQPHWIIARFFCKSLICKPFPLVDTLRKEFFFLEKIEKKNRLVFVFDFFPKKDFCFLVQPLSDFPYKSRLLSRNVQNGAPACTPSGVKLSPSTP